MQIKQQTDEETIPVKSSIPYFVLYALYIARFLIAKELITIPVDMCLLTLSYCFLQPLNLIHYPILSLL